MSETPFKTGDHWHMRGGEIARIGAIMDSGNVSAYWPGRMSVFAPDGRYWFHDEETVFDLIERVTDEVPA